MIKIGTIVKVSSSKLIGLVIDKQDKFVVAFTSSKAGMYNAKELKELSGADLLDSQIRNFEYIAKMFQINPINLNKEDNGDKRDSEEAVI